MQHDFDLDGVPSTVPKPQEEQQQAVRPTNLPLWRDEDHLPPEEPTEAKAEPVNSSACGMTAEEAQRKFCLWLEQQVGYREGNNNQNKYADTPGLSEMYGWYPQNQLWCDVFYDAGMIDCFGLRPACEMTYQPMGAGSALCKQSAQYYKDHGAWFQTPELGDQIFFYSSGDINHTGGVVGVAGGFVTTVEGNSSDMVAKRIYSVGDGKIAGYGRPNWSFATDINVGHNDAPSDTVQNPQKDARSFNLRFPYLQRGSIGAAVIGVQFQLMGQGYSVGPDGADGDFGGNTEEAVKEFQLNVHLTADGIVGPETAARLFGGEVVAQAQTVQPEQATKKEAEQLTEEETRNGLFELLKKLWRKEQ